jgi:hypothetical protein
MLAHCCCWLKLLLLSLLQAGVCCDVVVDNKQDHDNDAKPALQKNMADEESAAAGQSVGYLVARSCRSHHFACAQRHILIGVLLTVNSPSSLSPIILLWNVQLLSLAMVGLAALSTRHSTHMP